MPNFKNLLYAYNLTKYDKGRLLPLSVTVHPTRFPYSSYTSMRQVSPVMTKLIHNIAKSFLREEKGTELHLESDTSINEIRNDTNATENQIKKHKTIINANESQTRGFDATNSTTVNNISNKYSKELISNQKEENTFTFSDLKDPLVSLLSQITAIKPIKRTGVIFIRTDYMLQGTQPVQVEINTISCAFVFMGPKINNLHALFEDGVEVSRSDDEFCAMILAVWRCFVHDRSYIDSDDNRSYMNDDRMNELVERNEWNSKLNGIMTPEACYGSNVEFSSACNDNLNDTLRSEAFCRSNVNLRGACNYKNIYNKIEDESNNKEFASNNEALITNNERTSLHNNNFIMLMVDNCVTEDSGNYFEKIEIIKKMKEKGIDVIHVTFDELIKELKYKKKEMHNEDDFNRTNKGINKGNEIEINNSCNENNNINDYVKNTTYIDNAYNECTNNKTNNEFNNNNNNNNNTNNEFNNKTNNINANHNSNNTNKNTNNTNNNNTNNEFNNNNTNKNTNNTDNNTNNNNSNNTNKNSNNNIHNFYDFDEIEEYIKSLLNTQKPCDIEYDLIYKDKTVFFIYYRWFYNLSHYTEKYTLLRAILECSSAVSLPSAELQIAGSKSIQVKLKDEKYIKKFLTQKEIIKVKDFFGDFKELRDLKEGDENLFILKSLNEGGGNNIFGEDIIKYKNSIENKLTDNKDTSNNNKVDFDKNGNQEGDNGNISNKIINEGSNNNSNKTSKRVGNETSSDYDNINKVNNDSGVFLMRKIESPTFINRFLNDKNDRVIIPEVGIMGWGLIRNGELVINKNAGYICRTKDKDSKECGVSCGFGALDSIYKN
ncbi:Glutathione synthetase [Conglomerata obtusa]